jgi:flagellar biosynthetic protein FliQ
MMGPDQTVEMMRKVLMEAMMLSAPLLVAACVVSLVVSLVQTLTSVQEQTLTVVPRLVVVFVVTMATLPWMVHRMVSFTIRLFTDFHRYLG